MIQEWKKRRRVRWDATEGSDGGAERSAWAALLEMEKCNYVVEEAYQGQWIPKLLRKCRLKWCMLRRRTAVFLERVLFEYFVDTVSDVWQSITAILPGSKWWWCC